MRRIFTLVLVAAVLEIRTPCDAAFLERGSQQPLQYNLRHPDKVEPEVSNCENCTWQGTNATLSASRPHQRARKLTNEIATARKRIEQKLIVLESLQNAAVALGVASKDSPLSQLTVSHYEDFFANSSNAKFLFGETPADASFLQTEELPYDNLWHFHGVPGKKCEAKCMQGWVTMRSKCVACLNGFHACTQGHVLDAISTTTFHSSIHDVCQNIPKPLSSVVPEWPELKGGCCSFDFEACPAPLCLVEEMPAYLKSD